MCKWEFWETFLLDVSQISLLTLSMAIQSSKAIMCDFVSCITKDPFWQKFNLLCESYTICYFILFTLQVAIDILRDHPV
jgi:hypothetical protein